MPIRWWIEKERRRVCGVVSGDFTTDELLRTIRDTAEHEDFEPGFDILSDHREVGEPLTTEQAKHVSSYVRGLSDAYAGCRWAVVTTKPASWGMIHMLAVFLEDVPVTLRVFRRMEEADEWLSQPRSGDEAAG